MVEYILKIELEDGLIVRGDYYGNYDGVLRLCLNGNEYNLIEFIK